MIRFVLLLLAASACDGLATASDTGALTQPCTQNICQTLEVPTDVPTIQIALDQISDGGTIVLRPGVYAENLAVSKHVHLVGRNGVTLRSPDPQLPLLAFAPGAGGSVEQMRLRPSGDGIVGIAASPNDTVASPDVALSDLVITGGGTGIAGTFAALSVSDVHISGTLAGVLLDALGPGGATFDFLDVFEAGGAQVVIHNTGGPGPCTGSVTVTDSTFVGRKVGGPSRSTATDGGLSIIGDYCPVEVDRCTFPGDFGFGLALVDTGAFTVDNCEAYNTHLDSDGLWGVGVVVYQSAPSSACVIGNSITGLRSHDNAGPGLVVRGTQCALGITGGDYERNTSFGILAADTSYTHIIGANVVDTRADADGLFGDGIIVVNSGPGSTVNSTLSVITNSARAGITNFGGLLELGFNKLECNPIALDGETYLGSAPGFIDDGEDDNTCGCGGTTVTCQVLSSGLAAPTPPPTKL